MKLLPIVTPMVRFLGFVAAVWLGTLSGRLLGSESSAGDFSERQAIQKRLEIAHAELAQLPDSAEPSLREGLQEVEAACQYHLSAVDFLTAAQDELARATQESSAWSRFPQPPPYSVVQLDEIRESLATLENSEHTAQAQLHIFKAEVDGLREKLVGHQQAERRFMEEAEKAANPQTLQRARQSAMMENLSARVTAEKIGRRQLRIATEQANLDTIVAKKELAIRQLNAIGGKTVFTREHLDRLLQQISRKRQETSLTFVDESRTRKNPNPLLTWEVEFLDAQKAFWESRFAAAHSADPAEVRSAMATLKGLQSRIDDWVKISELRLSGGDPEMAGLDPTLLRDAVLQVRAMQRRIGFAIADLEGSDLRGKGTSLLGKIGDTLLSIWNAELYLVEESDIVDGKKIPIYRAVTVGKLVHLAFILVVGWFVLRFLSLRTNALVARRGNVPQATADLAGKWAFGIGLALLMCYGLNRVSIPLTVFAFLGGALAIGIGFGTQTLLKNFISGIILLFERPLKIGDVIEVAGITGTIKLIGIRASVIQHFDGIETLVPNSILLENQLTNWNFSNTVIRHSIVVGVAYGSPTREVSRLLLAVAAGHGLVKDDPAPEVRFEDFADNALTFCLLFWLDTRKTARNTLASDLRFMIDKAFTEAGIVIAFPQRDLHFDSENPLRVELFRATKTTTAEKVRQSAVRRSTSGN